VRDQLDGIRAFFTDVREVMRRRLEEAGTHQLLEDWQVADRGLELRAREVTLRKELTRIQRAERRLAEQGTGN
jgi:hypothetical protein